MNRIQLPSLRGAHATQQSSFAERFLDCFACARNDKRDTRCANPSTSDYSSGSTLTIEAPWLLPTQKVTGVVELSTNTRLMLVLRGRR
jgi:hypothetical protein